MYRLEGVVKHYRWGSTTALPELLGVESDGKPWAEIWFGSHPSSPSKLIDADPDAIKQFAELPFMVKLLAAAEPLSLQVHPNAQQAKDGYERENIAGIALDDPARIFVDPHPKPELIVALDTFEALCGFRNLIDSASLLESLAIPQLAWMTASLQDASPDPQSTTSPDTQSVASSDALHALISQIMHLDKNTITNALKALAELNPQTFPSAHPASGNSTSGNFAAAVDLAQRYPNDPAVLVALLMNHVTLAPGEALFLDAGMAHCYLRGTVLEVLTNSDNVIRGGLTTKHVAPEIFCEHIATNTEPLDILTEPYSTKHFSVTRIDPQVGQVELKTTILLCAQGTAVIDNISLHKGEAAWIPAHASLVTSGTGTLFHVTTS